MTRDDVHVRRHLLLVRHAKSSWDDPGLADHDRPLAPRGRKAVSGVRGHLERVEHHPGIVLCSSSRRTEQTLDGIRAALPASASVVLDEALYLANADALLARLHRIDDDIDCAMVIGHNPALQNLALMLVGTGDADMRERLAAKLPTGAVATLSFDRPWAGLGPAVARIDDLFMPRPPRRSQ